VIFFKATSVVIYGGDTLTVDFQRGRSIVTMCPKSIVFELGAWDRQMDG